VNVGDAPVWNGSTWVNQPAVDDGLPGILTPNGPQWTTTTLVVVAGRGYFGRFVLYEPKVITAMLFTVTSAATSDDPVEVGIANSAGVQVATSGAVTGKLNSIVAPLKSVPVSTTLAPGVYYSSFLCPTVGGTGATVVGCSFQRVEVLPMFGSTLPNALGCQQAGLAALPGTIVPAFLTGNVIMLGVKE
jgi:hypothetical protein